MCAMKNITLSLPDDLLEKSREYAQRHRTTLNDLVRKLLREKVERNQEDPLTALFAEMDEIEIKEPIIWKRDELYER
jgi:metal-responsive CopG/Arc/MetJ family transcriptional regulator